MLSSPSTPLKVEGRLPAQDHTPKNPSPLRQVMSMDTLATTPKPQPAPPPKMKLALRTKEVDSNGTKDDSDGSVFGGPPAAKVKADEDAARDHDGAALSIASLPRFLSPGVDVSDAPAHLDDSPAKASSTAYHFNNTPPRGADNNNNVDDEDSLPSSPTSPTSPTSSTSPTLSTRTIRVTIRERSHRNAQPEASAEPPRTPTLAPARPVQGCTPAIPINNLPSVSSDEDQESQPEPENQRGRNDDGHAKLPEQDDGADTVDTEQANIERRRERKRERASRKAKEREARKRLERYERAHLERERARQSICQWLGVPADEASRDGEDGGRQLQDGQVGAQGAGARPVLTSFPPPTFPPPDHPLPALPGASKPNTPKEGSQSKEAEPGPGDGTASSKQEQGDR